MAVGAARGYSWRMAQERTEEQAPAEEQATAEDQDDDGQATAEEQDDDGQATAEDRGDGGKPVSEITAPSIGPNTQIEHKPPEERLDHDKISDVDAMGLDKRRQVVGHSYSASFGRQALLYGIFLAVVAALVIGGKMLADELDAPPAEYADEAPWSQPDAEQRSPRPLQ